MTPNTQITPPVFITDRPDWNKQVLVDRTANTSIFISENATEQRQRRRTKSKIGISYNVEAMSPPEAFARELKILMELQAPVVIPVWPYSFPVASGSGSLITIGVSLAGYPFRAPGYILVNDAVQGDLFYQIASFDPVAGTVTTVLPLAGFYANTICYPCIQGTRRDGSSTLMTEFTETSETIAVDEQ